MQHHSVSYYCVLLTLDEFWIDGHVSDVSVIYLYFWWHLGTRGNATVRYLLIMPDWIPLVDGLADI